MVIQDFMMRLHPVFENGWLRVALIVAVAFLLAFLLQVISSCRS